MFRNTPVIRGLMGTATGILYSEYMLRNNPNYKKLAKIASKLFFIINDFSLIDTMYQFSLDSYIGLFSKTIK